MPAPLDYFLYHTVKYYLFFTNFGNKRCFGYLIKAVKLLFKFPVQLVNVFIVHKYILTLDQLCFVRALCPAGRWACPAPERRLLRPMGASAGGAGAVPGLAAQP